MAKNQAQRKLKNQDFAVRLSCMMAEAGQLGLYITMQKLHQAVQTVGWEISDQGEKV